MASKVVLRGIQEVKPILSVNKTESRRRALNLYRAWYRQLPYIVTNFHIPLTTTQCKSRLRSQFNKNKDLKDLRVIDMLVIKGQMELMETVNNWKQRNHVMQLFDDFSAASKSKDFLSKFYEGHEQ
ncbi:NADH dehydrogenase [ubiquinone] 1 alpha subcomplex subunit 6-like [Mizuhopecten yessoensis]|uniref:NADH dehydrogenase [ubiquinone] 1 alpha subcomplex subunit 6 n=1 Tax=Mizuhopecten yessoensis TaxID=6573 RepID=A0A210QGN6_MIZYE|nr:NADH dehydrogenase [ubiquinone] 1 alpha subcomplex subunit 6-like [Mizuhopecten yessoensis]OWF47781.1 NADH dehydrogenase [ubiquinone] 1 alpha subcomplex subunit 6 [Mizuhopecten yessoensis]